MKSFISISVDGIFAGSGKIDNGVIRDVGIQFSDDAEESESVYVRIEDSIRDGKNRVQVNVSDRESPIVVSWEIASDE